MKEKEALLEVRSLCVRYPGNEKGNFTSGRYDCFTWDNNLRDRRKRKRKKYVAAGNLTASGQGGDRAGRDYFCGQNLQTMSETKQRAVRGSSMGVVFQGA